MMLDVSVRAVDVALAETRFRKDFALVFRRFTDGVPIEKRYRDPVTYWEAQQALRLFCHAPDHGVDVRFEPFGAVRNMPVLAVP